MTGVIEGSGGTGVLEGHRPGTGVSGGVVGPPTPLLVGADTSVFTTSFVTVPFTAIEGRAMYIAAVVTGGSSSTPTLVPTVTGMGMEWTPLTSRLYRNSGSNEGRMDTYWASGEATDGSLTIAGQSFGRVVVVFAVEEGNFPLNVSEFPLYTNPAVTATPTPEEWETVIAIHGLSEIGQPTTLDPAFSLIGESPPQAQTLKVYASYHKPEDLPANYTFQNASNSNGVDVVMFTMAALPVLPYSSVVSSLNPSARYPLRVKSTAPDIDGYDTEIQKAQYDLDVWYPLVEKTATPGGLSDYDALVQDDLDPSFFVVGDAKGSGTDPGDYDALVQDDLDPSFFVVGDAKGTGTDPETYDTAAQALSASRYVPGDTIDPADPLPVYDDFVETFSTSRYVRGDTITELSGAIMALGPVGYYRMNETGSTGIDTSGNDNDGTYTGDFTPQAEPGPDTFDYVRFLSDFIGPGHGGRLSIPTTAVDGSFSPAGHGATWVMLLKRDTPNDLGYMIAKRTDVSTDREYDMSYSGGQYRVSAFDDTENVMMETIANSANTTDWELVIYRCPNISPGGADPFDIFVDDTPQLATTVAESSGIGYEATDSPIGIGGFPDTNAYGHNGAMAHVAVFDYELSDAQIDTIVAAAIADGWI